MSLEPRRAGKLSSCGSAPNRPKHKSSLFDDLVGAAGCTDVRPLLAQSGHERGLAANDPKQPSIAHPEYILGSKLQCPNWSKAVADLKDLLGTWAPLSWEKETIATGETIDVLGPDPVGY